MRDASRAEGCCSNMRWQLHRAWAALQFDVWKRQRCTSSDHAAGGVARRRLESVARLSPKVPARRDGHAPNCRHTTRAALNECVNALAAQLPPVRLCIQLTAADCMLACKITAIHGKICNPPKYASQLKTSGTVVKLQQHTTWVTYGRQVCCTHRCRTGGHY